MLNKLTILMYKKTESTLVIDLNKRQADSYNGLSESYQSDKDSTALGRGSDVPDVALMALPLQN